MPNSVPSELRDGIDRDGVRKWKIQSKTNIGKNNAGVRRSCIDGGGAKEGEERGNSAADLKIVLSRKMSE